MCYESRISELEGKIYAEYIEDGKWIKRLVGFDKRLIECGRTIKMSIPVKLTKDDRRIIVGNEELAVIE